MRGWISAGNQFCGERIHIEDVLCDVCETKATEDQPIMVLCQQDLCSRGCHAECMASSKSPYLCEAHGGKPIRQPKRKHGADDDGNVTVGQEVCVWLGDKGAGNLANTVIRGHVNRLMRGGRALVDLTQLGANWGARVQLEELSRVYWSVANDLIPKDRLECDPRSLKRGTQVLVMGETRTQIEVFWIAEFVSRSANTTKVHWIGTRRTDEVDSDMVYTGF